MLKETEPFRCVAADCPWPFKDKLPEVGNSKRGASKNYRTMSVKDIENYLYSGHLLNEKLNALAAGGQLIADDALLFLWRVGAMQEEALRVIRAWDFVPKAELVWVKTDHHEDGLLDKLETKLRRYVNSGGETGDDHYLKMVIEEARRPSFGMGHYTRQGHEVCLIARRGKAKVRHRSQRSVFFAPIGAHSEKPEAFYKIVEKLAEGPYLELFARKVRPGWTQVGDEIG